MKSPPCEGFFTSIRLQLIRPRKSACSKTRDKDDAVTPTFDPVLRRFLPGLPAFLTAHPALRVELLISDAIQDLIAEGADLAIRFGELEDSSLGARKLGMVPRMLVASPAYLRERGRPANIGDLSAHDLITGPLGTAHETWTFEHNGLTESIKVHARVFVGAAEGVIACAREGLGIAIARQWLCEPELRSGQLVTILDEYRLSPAPVHAIYAEGAKGAIIHGPSDPGFFRAPRGYKITASQDVRRRTHVVVSCYRFRLSKGKKGNGYAAHLEAEHIHRHRIFCPQGAGSGEHCDDPRHPDGLRSNRSPHADSQRTRRRRHLVRRPSVHLEEV